MRYACGIFVGAAMIGLLAAAVVAVATSPSGWTWFAFGAAAAMNATIWAGFGRALYDVFFPEIFSRGDRS